MNKNKSTTIRYRTKAGCFFEFVYQEIRGIRRICNKRCLYLRKSVKSTSSFLAGVSLFCLAACGTDQSGSAGIVLDDTVEPTIVGTAGRITDPENQSNQTNDKVQEDAYEVRLLIIEPYKTECESYHLSQCWLNKPSEEAGVEYVYETIHGFNYQWGYQYQLLVSVTTETTLMSDVHQQRIELIEIISQSRYHQHESFEYVARYANESITRIAQGVYRLAGGQTMVCEASSCASIDSVLAQDQSTLIEVEYSDQPGGALKLAAVVCAESRAAFNSTCMGREQ